MRFFTSFYLIVTAKLVFSSQCHEGYFSEEHNKCISCPEHCQFCNSSKSCLYCEDGYWGNICERPCSRCQPKTRCAKPNGFCIDKCKDGYTGSLCDAFCNDKCFNCDKMNADLCGLCALGRYGESCDKRCPEFCKNNVCDNSGYCTYGCDTGYWDPKCGNNCSSNCNSSCDTQTGKCTSGCKSNFVVSKCDSVQNEEVQTTNDDKENKASRQGGEIWHVILIVVAVLIVIVSVVICIVFRKRLINLRRRGHTRQDKPPAERPLFDATEMRTSKDSGVSSQESPPSPHTHATEADLSLTCGLLHETMEAPDVVVEEVPSPSVKNNTESDKHSVCENGTGLEAEALSLESLSVRHFSDVFGTKAYIICKDPTKTSMTYSVFWKLVWQEGCSIIVKLSGGAEETRERIYWPEKKKKCIYGDFIVINEGEVLFDDYRRRTFTIKKDQNTKPRNVEQIQFIKWPIFKLPEDKSLINFRHEVNKDRKTCHGPILVHCRNGFSRSCVFVAMDILLDVLEKKDCGEIENVLIKLGEKGLITTTEHRTFLRRSWEIFSTQMNTKESLSAQPNKASPSV